MKAKGSFNVDMGLPPEPKKAEEVKREPNILETPEVPDEPNRDEQIKALEEELRVKIEDDDIWQVLFGNTLEKRYVCIVPNKMYATFRTLSMSDTNHIETKLSEVSDSKMLRRGFDNLNTQYVLAAGVLELGKPNAVKSIGISLDDRIKSIEGMSALVVDLLAKKWGSFSVLLDLMIKRESQKGNS